jgi:DNA-binding NarL/FixJ family response regulator
MNVLVIDSCPDRRAVVADAMGWVEQKYQLFSASSLREAREMTQSVELTLIIVGPDLPEDTLAAIIFLRGWEPNSRIITGTLISHYDREHPGRLLNCGADQVFDVRLSASRLALIIRPYLLGEKNTQLSQHGKTMNPEASNHRSQHRPI